ncbi:MAG: HNH endonuclease signature motif containing protein, partial [Boseongicola sp.]|nr:HNH endonuclease signature motif containing protein [Boseongicola sp.]
WQKMQQQHACETPPCEGCGRAPGLEYMEVDHIVPRSRGGEHVWSNVQLLCGPCNRSKGNKTWAAWKREARQKAKTAAVGHYAI